MEPRGLSIQEAHQQLATRQLSCKELVRSVLDAIDTLNPTLNAFVRLADPDALIAEADSRDTRGIDRERPLDGIPIGLKDNYAMSGLVTAAGSRILEGWVPAQDAISVTALKQAGAIVLGKLNMHEFANGATNDNPHTGRPLNPWDVSRTPGGSSGGSAVALATDMCLGATGSDTGGSIRTPAALTGVVGLKPTYGLVPRSGVVPFSYSLDHAGPMGRTVGDTALLLEAMAGQDPADPVCLNRSFALRDDWDGDIRGTVIGVETSYTTSLLDDRVRAIFDRLLQTLESQGANLVEVKITSLDAALAAETTILFSEALSLHRDLLASRLHDYSQDVMISLLSGAYYTGEDYVAAQRYRTHLRRMLDECFARVDILAMPTVIMPAPEWGSERFDVAGESLDVLNGLIRLTAPFNLSGHPALSVPGGLTDDGLPVGIQFAAGHLRDDVLFRVGAAVERSIGRLRPPQAASA